MTRRISWMIAGLAVAVATAIIGMQLEDKGPQSGIKVPADAPGLRAVLATPSVPEAMPVTNTTAGQDVASLIAATGSGDAATRAAAITALAEAPRAEAVPALGRILTDGEPEIDRPLALRSLRDLALNQGDADGRIRDAVRHALYHGDDYTKADDVQEALEIIEESLQGQ